ncbi:MAG: DUF2057 domain-containing protein [Treponema sp.]|jgi:hypothetical protein|nr:DUF2057 domain-containing protein [Treponema sp.]
MAVKKGELMKKRLVFFYFPLLLIMGCATSYEYDKNLRPEESCTLTVNAYLDIVSFDGKKVYWSNNESSKFTVTIPEGEHLLSVYYHEEYPGVRYSITIPLTYTFKAGHTYTLAPLMRLVEAKMRYALAENELMENVLARAEGEPEREVSENLMRVRLGLVRIIDTSYLF